MRPSLGVVARDSPEDELRADTTGRRHWHQSLHAISRQEVGKEIEKDDPCPGTDSTPIVPLIFATVSFTI